MLYRGFPLHPDDEADPFAFRLDLSAHGIGSGRIVFSRERRLGTTTVHLDLMPVSLQKQPEMTNPRRWARGALGALALAGTTIAVRRQRAG